MQTAAFSLTEGTPSGYQSIITDEEESYGVGGKILRVAGAINIQVVEPAGVYTPTDKHIIIGLCIGDQDVVDQIRINTNEDADRRFLARQNLGWYPPGTGISGTVSTYGFTERFDWAVRGGRGVTVRKDDSVAIMCGIRAATWDDLAVVLNWAFWVLVDV